MLVAALDHLREFDAPATMLPSGSVAALAAALPAALAGGSPRAMVAGAYHVARMLDPAETTALATVAVVVAAATLLEGRRDFVADVVAALRANDAPDPVLDAMRTIPRDPRTPPPVPHGETPDPLATVTWLLWAVYHRPRGVEVMREMAIGGGIAPTVGALVGRGVWRAGWNRELAGCVDARGGGGCGTTEDGGEGPKQPLSSKK